MYEQVSVLLIGYIGKTVAFSDHLYKQIRRAIGYCEMTIGCTFLCCHYL